MRISDWSSDVCSSDLAELRHPLGTRAQHQVIGVAKNDLGAAGGDLLGRQPLHGAGGAHRHEGGRVDDAVRGGEAAAPGGAVLGRHLIGEPAAAQDAAPRSSRQASQLGSASWRDRVCPYVWLQVGAVSFKKTKHEEQANSPY